MPQKMFLRIAMISRIVVWSLILLAVLFGGQIVSSHLFPCLWYENYGWLCPTCGASRAVVSLFTGDFSAAVGYNPVVVLGIVPVVGVILLSDLVVMIWNLFGKERRLSLFEYCFSVFGAKFTREKRKAYK